MQGRGYIDVDTMLFGSSEDMWTRNGHLVSISQVQKNFRSSQNLDMSVTDTLNPARTAALMHCEMSF